MTPSEKPRARSGPKEVESWEEFEKEIKNMSEGIRGLLNRVCRPRRVRRRGMKKGAKK